MDLNYSACMFEEPFVGFTLIISETDVYKSSEHEMGMFGYVRISDRRLYPIRDGSNWK